ncbi:hypothetical protein Gxy13693_008_031 [Komagataeibacter xylinus NBRC 13693]|uniref:Uncharacterized protein n=1 Tax=Komagataeibacter xylinus NBRC 13693 TaxID=1234668 RepID=A0A0D6Q519_KOMXY|nr:hypothetical protein Gxy13693_008_031 [Komagataeibacter xylinus NBRC 13693]
MAVIHMRQVHTRAIALQDHDPLTAFTTRYAHARERIGSPVPADQNYQTDDLCVRISFAQSLQKPETQASAIRTDAAPCGDEIRGH